MLLVDSTDAHELKALIGRNLHEVQRSLAGFDSDGTSISQNYVEENSRLCWWVRFVDHSWNDVPAEKALAGARISGLVGPWCGKHCLGILVLWIPLKRIRQNLETMDSQFWMYIIRNLLEV